MNIKYAFCLVCFLNFLSVNAIAQVDFATYRHISGLPNSTGANIQDVVTGDFNEDGHQDIVGTDDNGTMIFLNDGSGSYPIKMQISAQTMASLVVGDFNNDNNLDVAFVFSASFSSPSTIGVFLGNGQGNFSQPIQFTSNIYFPSRILTNDFNNDGNLDLIIGAQVGLQAGITIFLGNGTGNFTQTHSFTNVGSSNRAIATGDLNNDGNQDLIVAGSNPFNILFILWGNGTGNFSIVSLNLGIDSMAIIIDDLNSDSQQDLIINGFTASGGRIVFFYGNGSGNFNLAFSVPVSGPTVGVADLNGDHLKDVVSVGTQLTVIMNEGNSQYRVLTKYGVRSGRLAIADINSDKIPDLLSGVSPIFGLGNGEFLLPPTYPQPSGQYGEGGISCEDLNNDQKIDLLTTRRTFLGDGSGSFRSGSNFNLGFLPSVLTTDDFNNDSNIDLIAFSAFNYGGLVLLGNGQGVFLTPITLNLGFQANSLGKGDFNRDGNLDLILVDDMNDRLFFLLGQGNGTFSSPALISSSHNFFKGIVADDFNGDTNLDFIVGWRGTANPNIEVYLGDGSGNFTPSGSFTAGQNQSASTKVIKAGDINNDNFLDLIIGIAYTDKINVLFGNGQGQFSVPVEYDLNLGGSHIGGNIHLVDINKDNALDIMVETSGYLAMLLNDRQGNLIRDTSFGMYQDLGSSCLGQFNGDGYLDIAAAGTVYLTSTTNEDIITVLYSTTPLEVPSQFPTIQAAVDAASNFGRVLVDAGTYNENIYLKGKSIKLKSKQGAFNTILDGSNIDAVISLQQGEKPWTSVEGFIIRNGNGMLAGNTGEVIAVPTGAGGATFARAGGININGVSPLIRDNIIINNVGIKANGISLTDSLNSARLIGNILALNVNSSSVAGGVYSTMSNPILRSNILYETNCSVYATNNSKLNLGNIGNAETADDGGNIITNVCVVNNTPNEIKAENNYWGMPGNYLQTPSAVLQALGNNGNTGPIDVDPLGQ